MGTRTEVQLERKTDRWRYTCPQGHRSWEPTNFHFWCQQCSRHLSDDVDPEFDELRDRRTGDLISREDIELPGYDD
nr:hypothetical protein [Natrinema sp. DC36]